MPSAPRFDGRDLLFAAVINIVWGLNIIAVKLSVNAIPPFTAAFLRQALLVLCCGAFLKIVPGRMPALLALSVIAGGIFLMFVNTSLVVSTNVGALAIAGQLGAPFALILAVFFLGERIGLVRIIGIVLAMTGCGMLVFDPRIGDDWLGLALTAGGSFAWAVGSTLQRQLAGVPVLTIYAWIGLGGVLILGPVALAVEPGGFAGISHAPPLALGCIGFSALGSTLVGQGGMAWLLKRHPVSSVIPLTLGAPVIAVVASSLVFSTPITPIMVAGGILALAGVAIVTIRTAAKGEAKGQA